VHEEPQNRSASTSVDAKRPAPAPRDRHRFWRGGIMVAAVAVLILVTALAAWYWDPSPSVEARSAPRLSIVVLPFANLNNDPEQQYFIDAVTDDLTTDLSRTGAARHRAIPRSPIRTSRSTPSRSAARLLRYVLEGSVRRSGNQLRVNAQLIDTVTNAHLWAERFDGDAGDLSALEDEITRRIAVALGQELVIAEAARPTERPDALDYLLRARAVWLRPASREHYREVIGLFERALALDPKSAGAQISLAIALTARVLDGFADSRDSGAADIVRAEELAGQALKASPRSPGAHHARGRAACAAPV
jgi:TolB-like protein